LDKRRCFPWFDHNYELAHIAEMAKQLLITINPARRSGMTEAEIGAA
jgi:hypothetical protein